MKKTLSVIAVLVLIIAVALGVTACSEAEKVSSNISNEADNFNVERRLIVINNMTDVIEFEMTGLLSINADTTDNQLEVTVKESDGVYKKHFVGLSQFTTYIVEDTTGTNVSTRNYTLNFNPDMLTPFGVKDYNTDESK